MARSLWSGSIAFGLVNVPVKLVTAVREKKIGFHLLSPDGQCRLRQKLYCPDTGKEFTYADAARGYEVAPDQYVVISDEELDALKPDAARTIDIVQFADLTSVDPLYFDQPYMLMPGEGGASAYRLLAEAMHKSHRVAIARFVMRQREHVAVIRPVTLQKGKPEALVLHTMHYHEEVVALAEPPEEIPGDAKVPVKQAKVAAQLVEAMVEPFDPAAFKDDYRIEMEKLIEAKAEGHEAKAVSVEQEPPPRTFNLMEALKKSVEQQEQQHPHKGRRKTA